ncbi:hypothetical protein [Flavobacterium terrae]|uniref:PRC-barrel domain-containing protein n=1 Tax=Flavobacterium terrae TaxID=415425 RepID=A0A1M6D5C0_9FLAO|nr:hypothetical protein [Flavobacterium terrae]SHI68303.1 hypothetical protein SAMN05444363_1253 [Flavobacterium terrae]
MKKIAALSLLFVSSFVFAQSSEKIKYSKEKIKEMEAYLFEEVFTTVNNKKTSTVILKDGRVIKGYFKDIDRKKGQITDIKFKDSVTGKQEELDAALISELYLAPSGAEKGAKAFKNATNIRSLATKKMKKATNKETVYFKNQTVSLKNKKEIKEYLMQLINPEFNSIIEVYGDPNANETQGVSFGGMQMGGGLLKSFYLKKGDKVFWMHKSDFGDYYNEIFGDNPEFIKQYPLNSIEWGYLSFLIYEYTRMTEESKQ